MSEEELCLEILESKISLNLDVWFGGTEVQKAISFLELHNDHKFYRRTIIYLYQYLLCDEFKESKFKFKFLKLKNLNNFLSKKPLTSTKKKIP